MAHLTKKQQRELFIDEFLRRLREAPPGTRVYRIRDVNFVSRPPDTAAHHHVAYWHVRSASVSGAA
jgi:hypothetical protein